MIEKFDIIGLFGDRNIHIDFQKNENVKILIGENGTGKTHILNILYYILSGKIEKLADIEFERVILKIKNIDRIEIEKKDLIVLYSENLGGDCNCQLKKYLPPSDYRRVQYMIEEGYSPNKILNTSVVNKLNRRFSKSRILNMLKEAIIKYKRRELNLFDFDENPETSYENIKEKIRKIKMDIDIIIDSRTLIYLPTYRRVEEDLEKLGLSNIIDEYEIRNNDKFIQFGMDDTERYIRRLLDDIKKLSLEGFNEMSGDIINTLIDNNSNNIDETYSKTIKNIETLNIILDRSEKVSDNNKRIIIEKVENEEIFNEENKQLFLFLTKLIKIYNKQKKKDELIKKFKDICNEYLVNKNFFYNESAVDLYLKNEKADFNLDLNTLSSGEKQLVSIFARIYLACEKDFIIFIDEPEISMSMEWQKMILSDILDSGKCKLLFTTTHSPFIFDDEKGELEEHVVDIVLEATSDYRKNLNE